MEWIECTLGDILNFRRGYDLPHSEMKGGNVPVAGSNGVIGYHDVATNISPVITIGRSGNVGTPYIYSKAWAHNTTLYIDDFKGNDPLYLYYLVKSLPLSSFGGGSAVPTLNRNHIHPMEIKHCPDVKDQRRIAAFLKSFDDKIDLNNRINHNLEMQAQALYKSWFVDFEPFKDGVFVDSELGMIPEGWRVGSIYDICDIYYGAPFNSTLFNSEKKGLPLIRIRDLAKQEAGVFTEEIHPKGQLSNKGDILVGMDGEFSIYIWGGASSWINQRISRFSPKLGVSHYFLSETLRPQLKAVESSEVATTVIHIGKNDYDKFHSIIPTHKVLEAFYNLSEPLFLEYVENLSGNQELAKSREALLPRLMSGTIQFDC